MNDRQITIRSSLRFYYTNDDINVHLDKMIDELTLNYSLPCIVTIEQSYFSQRQNRNLKFYVKLYVYFHHEYGFSCEVINKSELKLLKLLNFRSPQNMSITKVSITDKKSIVDKVINFYIEKDR